MPSLECWVPASPKPPFWGNLRALALSLRRYGGRSAARAVLHVVFGPEASPKEIARQMAWGESLGVRWAMVPEEVFARDGIYGTALDRFCRPFTSELVLMLDADVLVTGSLDPLLRETRESGELRGLPAYVHPWEERDGWERLFSALALGPVPRVCPPSGRGVFTESAERMPAYFNLGAILAPARLMAEIGGIIFAEMAAIDRVVTSCYRCQLALAAAISRKGIPWRALPLRYNFINEAALARLHPWESWQTRILHYLRRGTECDREREFASPEALRSWLRRRDLRGPNRLLQRRLRALGPIDW